MSYILIGWVWNCHSWHAKLRVDGVLDECSDKMCKNYGTFHHKFFLWRLRPLSPEAIKRCIVRRSVRCKFCLVCICSECCSYLPSCGCWFWLWSGFRSSFSRRQYIGSPIHPSSGRRSPLGVSNLLFSVIALNSHHIERQTVRDRWLAHVFLLLFCDN